jgi:hypothetical protein
MAQALGQAGRQKRGLIVGMLTGPVVYMLYFMLVYLWAEGGCRAGLGRSQWLGWNAIDLGVVVLTLVAAAITAAGTVYTWRRWRQTKEDAASDMDSYPRFLSLVGLVLNGYHTLGILLTGFTSALLVLCEWT